MNFDYTLYIFLLPFLAFVINGLGSSKLGKYAGYISIAAIGVAAIFALRTAYQ